MNTFDAIVLAATLATVFASVLVLFLRRPLHALLVDLCGNEPRARFWSVYWAALLVLAAVFGLLVSAPLGDTKRWSDSPSVPLVLSGFRASLCAVLLVLGLLALVLLRSIARFERERHPRPLATEAGGVVHTTTG